MTPLGYFRKVEAFATYLRDVADDEREQVKLDAKCDAIDQAWGELSQADKLMVYNVVNFIHRNIQPKDKAAEPEKPLIQLVH